MSKTGYQYQKGHFWISFLAFAWISPIAVADNTPSSVSLENSAWAAKLSTKDLAASVTARLLTREDFPVEYGVDLQLQALLALGDATNERKYLEFVQKIMTVRKMPPGYRQPWKNEYFTSLSFDLFVRTQNKDYVEPFIAEGRKYRAEVLRAFDGIISYYDEASRHDNDKPVHRFATGDIYLNRKWQPILLDQVQEYSSRMAKVGCLSGDATFYMEAVQQFVLLRSALRDPTTGLWSHARGWFGSADSIAATKWGRGHAWVLRGLVETLAYLPPESPHAHRVLAMLQELAETLIAYQDEAGLWHQVLDRPDSYQETSVTGLISYYLARAVQAKLLPEKPYKDASIRGFEALARNKTSADGVVYGGSTGTPPLPSVEEYLRWATPINDAHGVAAVIFSAAGRLLLDGNASAFAQWKERPTCR